MDRASPGLMATTAAKAARKSIKSLASEYKGVLFRSRLEARWAAVFDHFEIKWVFEPDMFETPAGGYLPDFYFPDMNTYVEVKPGPGQFSRVAVESVAKQTQCQFLILDAPIIECRVFALFNGEWWDDMCWCCSEKYLGPHFHDGKPRWFQNVGVSHPSEIASVDCPFCANTQDPDLVRIRSMRFERGQAA